MVMGAGVRGRPVLYNKFIMSLLDQLFQYSSRNDQSSFCLVLEADRPVHYPLNSLIKQCSPPRLKIPSPKMLKQANKSPASIFALLPAAPNPPANADTQLYDAYKLKFSRINAMVRVAGNKIRKLQYQFFVKLENIAKKPPAGVPQVQILEVPDFQFELPAQDWRGNCQLIEISWAEVTQLLERKRRSQLGEAFGRIAQRGRVRERLECGLSILEMVGGRCLRGVMLEGFRCVKEVTRKKVVKVQPAKTIACFGGKSISGKFKMESSIAKLVQFQSPFHQLPLPLHPQRTCDCNPDIHDTINLFLISQDQRNALFPADEDRCSSSSSNVCVSVLEMKKEDETPVSSVVKFKSEEGSTPVAKFQKRGGSDFTSLSGITSDVGSSKNEKRDYQYRTQSQVTRVEPISEEKENRYVSEDHFGLNFVKKRLSLAQESERPLFYEELQPYQIKESCIGLMRKLSAADPATHSPIFEKYTEDPHPLTSIDPQILKFQIDQREINTYITYRKSLEQRKSSTLKEIEKSKETIKRLVADLKKPKVGEEKQKIKITYKKTNVSAKVSLEKPNSTNNSRKPSPAANARKPTPPALTPAPTPKKETPLKAPSPTPSHFHSIDPCPHPADIYYSYVKEKRKMEAIQSSAERKQVGYKISEAGCKKPPLKKSEAAQKNLLTISKYPACREKRIDLKVDLSRDPSKAGQKPAESKGKAQLDGYSSTRGRYAVK